MVGHQIVALGVGVRFSSITQNCPLGVMDEHTGLRNLEREFESFRGYTVYLGTTGA